MFSYLLPNVKEHIVITQITRNIFPIAGMLIVLIAQPTAHKKMVDAADEASEAMDKTLQNLGHKAHEQTNSVAQTTEPLDKRVREIATKARYNAEKIKKKADTDAEYTIANAKAEAERAKKNAEAKAIQNFSNTIENAKEKADRKARKTVAKAKARAEKIKEKADAEAEYVIAKAKATAKKSKSARMERAQDKTNTTIELELTEKN